ncbi:MAG: hypothetical protein NZ959_11290 [Armatimonadetes bacterium]|nr:hypothetical protein [Armatimonadota bacterium]MDW8122925.1 hypothetical protein [Armatimonadota bacterium]
MRRRSDKAFALLLAVIVVCLVWSVGQGLQSPSLSKMISGPFPFVDRLHGFSVQLPPFWRVMIVGNAIIIKDEGLHFIVIRGVRYSGDLREVAQKWWQERELSNRVASQFTGKIPRYAFNQTKDGIIIYGEDLGYPYTIDPQTSIDFSFLRGRGIELPTEYREVTAILPGKTVAILVTMLFPSEANEQSRRLMLEIVKSFRFLSPNEMVGWRPQEVRCPETGLIAATMHVPEEFEFYAGVIRQDKKRRVSWVLGKGETMLRKDHIDLQTNIIHSQFGGNALSVLIINGQVLQQAQPILLASKDDCIQLILALWRAETNRDWSLLGSAEIPMPPMQREFSQRMLQEIPVPPNFQGNREDVRVAFTAKSNNLIRMGTISGNLLWAVDPHPIAPTQSSFAAMEVTVTQAPEKEMERAGSIFNGFQDSFLSNPEWLMTTMEMWGREWREELRFVREMLHGHREFNSRMATAWTNLLSDQTYTKDPETGEIFRLHKRSWETGNFWREPVFGDVILGGVEGGSRLEELLKMEGWRKLTESLEGFPELWK